MNIDTLTIGEAKQLAAMFGTQAPGTASKRTDALTHVVVCTDKRGVVFGATYDVAARPIMLQDARMCLYWSADVGGVFGLADVGPTKDCKVSAVVPLLTLEGVTCVMAMDDKAVKAWVNAKVQGR